jgi:hypothetical protein
MAQSNSTNRIASTVQFPPIPLVSGDQLVDGEGRQHDVTEVLVVVRASNGVEKVVRLDARFGGWWVPVADLHAATA